MNPEIPPPARTRLKGLLAWLFVLGVSWFWWQSVRRLPLRASLEQARSQEGWLALAGLAAAVYLVGQAAVWRWILGDGGTWLPWRRAWRVWSVSNMGRYLPGSVWHLVGRVVIGQASGVERGAGTLGVVLEQGLQLFSALLVVVGSFPFWPGGSVVREWSWLAALIPLGLVGMHPRLFFPVLSTGLRLLRRPPLVATRRYGSLLGYTFGYVLVHLANGLALAGCLRALGVPLGLAPVTVGGALLAWGVGFVVPLAPGGLGVREVLVTEALGPLVGRDVASSGALLWRIANLLTEAAAAGLGSALDRSE